MGLQAFQDGQWVDLDIVGIGSNRQLITTSLLDNGPVDHIRFEITTSAPVTDKLTYRIANVEATNLYGGGRVLMDHVSAGMKGRGNSTWAAPKKPYKLKLDSAASLFGMPSSKSWAFMANYYDASSVRAKTIYEVARRATGRWLPRSVACELVLNGEYMGLYDFMETVEVDTGRLGIRKMKDTDVSGLAVTGPYLLQIDSNSPGDPQFTTSRRTPIGYDTPDVINVPEQVAYLSAWFETLETQLLAGNYDLFDLPALADWVLTQELAKNSDAGWRSFKFYKSQDTATAPGKFTAVPWDFDGCWNNTFGFDPDGGFTGGKPDDHLGFRVLNQGPTTDFPRYASLIYSASSDFRALVKDRWSSAWKPALADLPNILDAFAADIVVARARDRQKWWNGDPLPLRSTTADMKTWMSNRIAWLDANL